MSVRSLLILGRQPRLGLAELESLFGADKVVPFGPQAAVLDVVPQEVPFARLGGAIKLCAVFATADTNDFSSAQKLLKPTSEPFSSLPKSGKITLGVSSYNLRVSKEKVFATGLTLKKMLRNPDRSVRLAPLSEGTALNSAQVLHNKLTGEHGREIVLVSDGAQTMLGYTVAEQDIEDYTVRDRKRPKRDARVGMLPPKLAQIIINLASAAATDSPQPSRLLDPFCGTGVVLQEALLMGYDAYGTDLEPRMIEYSTANLEWLSKRYTFTGEYSASVGDATDFQWQPPVDLVACETYLGQPFNSFPSKEKLEKVIATCDIIHKKFLQNIGAQLPSGTRLCLAIPAWQEKPGRFMHLPALDHLEELGYNRISFAHARASELIYSRDDQVVARELLVITRK